MDQRTVNARQREVLTWIGQDCPPGRWTDTSYKVTALALQNRRLATVTKRRNIWGATITDAGRHFLEHGSYPDGHWTATAPPPTTTQRVPAPKRPPAPPRRTVTGRRPVDQLIADLLTSDGILTISGNDASHYKNLVASAIRHNKVPAGKVLGVEHGSSWREQFVRLTDAPAWMTATLEPVPVADHLRGLHPVTKRIRDDAHALPMKHPVRGRALRLLDATSKEAERRGWTIDRPSAKPGYQRPNGDLAFTVAGHTCELSVGELSERVAHTPTARELRRSERNSWVTVPSHDSVPSGRLRIQIHSRWGGRRDSFADGKTKALEDQLAAVLQEIELRAADAEERQIRGERAAQERAQQWRIVRAHAEAKALDVYRTHVLDEQVARWQRARSIEEYLGAMTKHITTLDMSAQIEGQRWLDWASSHAAAVDPLRAPLVMPDKEQFTTDELRPYMQGLSPHGPEPARPWD